MVVTDDESLAERVRLLRSHGVTSLSWDRHRGHAQGYDVVALGFNYRLDEPRAAPAASRLEADNAKRGRWVEAHREELTGVTGMETTLSPKPGCAPVPHLFAVVVAEGVDRDEVRQAIAEAVIQTPYPPVHRFSTYGANAPRFR